MLMPLLKSTITKCLIFTPEFTRREKKYRSQIINCKLCNTSYVKQNSLYSTHVYKKEFNTFQREAGLQPCW